MSKQDFVRLIANGLTRDQVDATSDVYYAVLAFDGLVSLGRELDADDGGAE